MKDIEAVLVRWAGQACPSNIDVLITVSPGLEWVWRAAWAQQT